MTFNLLNRRLHLYLGLVLLPWLFMYGISSLVFNHLTYFKQLSGAPQWTERFDRPYHQAVLDDADLRQVAARILKDVGLKGSFSVSRPNPRRLNINVFDFWSRTRLTYYLDQGRIVAEDQQPRLYHFLAGMHTRHGFEQEFLLSVLWSVVLDVVCVGFLVWIASGLYMWWQLAHTRCWGAIALAGGFVSSLVFLLTL